MVSDSAVLGHFTTEVSLQRRAVTSLCSQRWRYQHKLMWWSEVHWVCTRTMSVWITSSITFVLFISWNYFIPFSSLHCYRSVEVSCTLKAQGLHSERGMLDWYEPSLSWWTFYPYHPGLSNGTLKVHCLQLYHINSTNPNKYCFVYQPLSTGIVNQ